MAVGGASLPGLFLPLGWGEPKKGRGRPLLLSASEEGKGKEE